MHKYEEVLPNFSYYIFNFLVATNADQFVWQSENN